MFLVGLTDGTLPIQHAETPERDRGGAPAVLCRRHPGPHEAGAVLGAVPDEGGRRTRRRSRFLTGIAPDSATPGRAAVRRALPALRRPAARRPPQVKVGPVRRLPVVGRSRRSSTRCATWRKARSTEASVPAFVVFSDATLLAIAERRPTDNAALLSIPGIGRAKLDRYGQDVLEIVTSTR